MRLRILAMIVISLAAGACGGDGSTVSDAQVRNYCEVTKSIFRGQEQAPSDEEMSKWEAAAPGPIAADVKKAAAAYRDLNNSPNPDFAGLEQEPLVTSFERVERFNEEECGIKPG